jgi:proliferating cell nuclear antigen PCNA
MTIIFRAKTNEAYVIKILAELLANNIKTGCFEIDNTGISLRMMDHHRKILIDLKLESENFIVYLFNSQKMFLGINSAHFHRMLKATKKKDSLELFIDDEFPNDLGIKVTPKENTRITTSTIKIQTIQNLDIDIPNGYEKPITVSSSELQKMLKELGNIGNIINISSKQFSIKFSSNASGIYKRSVSFGEITEDDEEKDDSYNQDFNNENLLRITKLSGLSNNIQIYTGTPILLKSNIGSVGKISIYIKSKEQIDSETHVIGSDSDYE